MPLRQSIKDYISIKFGIPFGEIDEHICPCEKPIIDNQLLNRMFPERKKVQASKPISTLGRGYVRFGEGISAEEMDRRNVEILNRW